MSPEVVLMWVQIMVSISTLAGGAFWLGRLSGKVNTIQEGQNDMKASLFGTDGNPGAFVRRETLEIMLANLVREREATDDRITEQAERIGALERQG